MIGLLEQLYYFDTKCYYYYDGSWDKIVNLIIILNSSNSTIKTGFISLQYRLDLCNKVSQNYVRKSQFNREKYRKCQVERRDGNSNSDPFTCVCVCVCVFLCVSLMVICHSFIYTQKYHVYYLPKKELSCLFKNLKKIYIYLNIVCKVKTYIKHLKIMVNVIQNHGQLLL